MRSTTSRRVLLAACAFALLASAPAAQDTPVHTWSGTFLGDQWGDVTELLGDVDGDGVRDVGVGWRFGSAFAGEPLPVVHSSVGRVQIYSGATGDVLHIWHGNLGAVDLFGASLADAGDVNGDGFDDVLVGASNAAGFNPASGTVQLRSGADGTLLHLFRGFQHSSWFGAALATGDMDGDGLLDVAIGAPWTDLDDTTGAYREEGYVYVYRLTDFALIAALPGGEFLVGLLDYERQDYGGDLAYAGDTDGDGFGELLVAASWSDFTNGFTQTHLTNTGFVQRIEPVTNESQWYRRGLELEHLGSRITVLGDADGDGELDVAAGATGANGNLGRVTVWSGDDVSWTVEGHGLRPVGNALAAVEDATGDGLADLLIGASMADIVDVTTPLFDVGAVELRSGVDGELVHTWWGEQDGEEFGREVAAGKLTGSGFDAIVIAAPERDTFGGPDSEGAVLLYDPAQADASATFYGDGLAGTLGVPDLQAPAAPVLGTTFTLQVGNASGAASTAYLFLGLAPQSLNVKGGTLLVDALKILSFPMPAEGRELFLPVPLDYAFDGVGVFMQVLHTDAGAPLGVAFTRGLEATLGD